MITAFVGLLWSQFGGYLIAAGGGLLAVAVAYFKGRSGGAEQERNKQAADSINIVKDHKDAQEVAGSLSADDARRRLREWGR